jgi:hypothetical protein
MSIDKRGWMPELHQHREYLQLHAIAVTSIDAIDQLHGLHIQRLLKQSSFVALEHGGDLSRTDAAGLLAMTGSSLMCLEINIGCGAKSTI